MITPEQLNQFSGEFDGVCQQLHENEDIGRFLDPTLEQDATQVLAAFANLCRYMYVKIRVMQNTETEEGPQ